MEAYIPIPDEIALCVYLIAAIVPMVITVILGIAAFKHQQLEELERDVAFANGDGPSRIHKADRWDHTYTAAYLVGSVSATGLTLLLMTVWIPQMASFEPCQYLSATFYIAAALAVINVLIARWSASGWLDEHVVRPLLEEQLKPVVEKTAEETSAKLADVAELLLQIAKKKP